MLLEGGGIGGQRVLSLVLIATLEITQNNASPFRKANFNTQDYC